MEKHKIIEILERFGMFMRQAEFFGSEDYEDYYNEIIDALTPKGPSGEEANHKLVDFVDSCAPLTEYVDGDNIASRFKGLTIPVIEFNELRGKAFSTPPVAPSDEKIRKLLDDWNVQPPETQIAVIAPDSFTELAKSPHVFRAYLTEAIVALK